MSQQVINISNTVNLASGDDIRTALTKANENFTELYDSVLPSAIEYETANTVLILENTTSTFGNNVAVSGALTVAQAVVLLAGVSAIADGGSF